MQNPFSRDRTVLL